MGILDDLVDDVAGGVEEFFDIDIPFIGPTPGPGNGGGNGGDDEVIDVPFEDVTNGGAVSVGNGNGALLDPRKLPDVLTVAQAMTLARRGCPPPDGQFCASFFGGQMVLKRRKRRRRRALTQGQLDTITQVQAIFGKSSETTKLIVSKVL